MPIELKPVLRSFMGKIRTWRSDIWGFLNNIETRIANNHTALLASLTDIMASQVNAASRLVVYTVKLENADEEYSQLLPEHTKGFTIQITDGTAFRFSPEPGRVEEARRPYWSVAANSSYDEGDLDLHNTTLYFASSTADKTVEIFVKV